METSVACQNLTAALTQFRYQPTGVKICKIETIDFLQIDAGQHFSALKLREMPRTAHFTPPPPGAIEKTLLQRTGPELVTAEKAKAVQNLDLAQLAECSLPPINPEKHLQNIMDCILPPKKTEHKGQTWLERASTIPATRLDLLALEEKFEAELKRKKAKSFGIDPIRRQIYDQLFDELIRQVTINCAERGLMLLRVRDEVRLTIMSYQSLLESSIAYGIRKAIMVEKQQSETLVERDEEKRKNEELTIKVENLQKQLAQERLVKEEEVRLLEQTMKDENERLLESNKILKMHLQTIIQMDQQLQQQQTSLGDSAPIFPPSMNAPASPNTTS